MQVFIVSCNVCTPMKASCHKSYSLLQHLETSSQPWAAITLDFIMQPPESNGFMMILTMVAHLTKMAASFPALIYLFAEETAQLWINHIVCLHGLPDYVTSNWGPQLISQFWCETPCLLGVHTHTYLPSTYHPQLNGWIERDSDPWKVSTMLSHLSPGWLVLALTLPRVSIQ